MIVALAQYLLIQGYKENEITILTPYLGQLIKIREALSKVTMVFVDERDEEEIQNLTEGKVEVPKVEPPQKVQQNMRSRVRLATVDK